MSQRPRRGKSLSKADKLAEKMHKHFAHVESVMSQAELSALGQDEVAYIRVMMSDEAKKRYPAINDVPPGVRLYLLQSADGSPIALTDSLRAAQGHAMGDELKIVSLN